MRELSIVTSCHRYGVYLREWAASIVAGQHPGFVGILTHGREEDHQAGREALAILERAGIPAEHVTVAETLDFGEARNRAVALSSSEWVMHLDADDMLMPHAVAEIARLAPEADVVGLGYERCGDLAAGPRFRRKTYRSHRGAATLADPTPCSGVSPFRRSFWERSPYRTDMVGGWDTALWIGFGHLDARFVATKEPCFWYRQHADSVFNIRRKGGWRAHRTGVKLTSLRKVWQGVSVIVPWAGSCPHRQAAWDWLARRYAACHPDWQVVIGRGSADAWSKGAAIADALTRATGETLVIVDADCIIAPEALGEAVRRVRSGAAWVVPHNMVHRLSQVETEVLLSRDPAHPVDPPIAGLMRQPYVGFPGGGMVVVGRAEYEATGGIPRDFVGWGAEDEALAVILDTLLGPHDRLNADLIHCWHPPQRGTTSNRSTILSNRQRYHRVLRAKGDAELLWAMVSGGRGTYVGGMSDARTRHATLGARGQAHREELTGMIRDRFAERRLADQQRRDPMAAGLAMRRAYQQKRREQQARNEQAAKEAEARRLAAFGTKAILDATPNKMLVVEEVKFASSQAEEAAREAGLTDADFAGVAPGPRGITLKQVRELAG